MDSLVLAVLLASSSNGSFVATADIDGATLEIEIRQPVGEQKAEEIVEWIESTANTVNLAYGRFPNPSPKIIVIGTSQNSWGSDSPVIFGRVTRQRHETVELFVNYDRPIEDYYDDWTATHEFSHLMLPLLSQRYRWISEGFASYYQNILMSRSGRYTPELAWQRLSEGFERGQKSRPELSPNEAAAGGIRVARMKVYWSGAAIALLADVELRQRSGGKESLDTVLDQLQQCCLPSRKRWTGQTLFRRMDSFLETPVFMPLYRQHADNDGFPELGPLLDRLGVSRNQNGVTLSDEATLSDIRDTISGQP